MLVWHCEEGTSAVRKSSKMKIIIVALVAEFCLSSCSIVDPLSTLECHRRQYNYKVQKSDENGRMCWDFINVMSCWGRCDSNEIADWKFPYKQSHHPVCMHAATQDTETILKNCDDGVAPGTEIYIYHEATGCACKFCRSSGASCEGLRYRGARKAPEIIKRLYANGVANSEYDRLLQ